MNIEKFSLLDEISDISLQENTIVTKMTVPTESSILDEHFPGNPVMPGVLLVEIMAQSAGNLAMAKLDFAQMAVLATVAQCRFVDFVVPKDELTCTVTMLKCDRGFTVNDVEITRLDGDIVKTIAKGQLRMKILDFFSESLKQKLINKFNEMKNHGC